jgi:trk system potassium uptake protein TrkA
MNPNLRGFLELPDDYEIAEIQAPAGVVGRSLGDIDLSTRYNLRLITIRRTYDEGGEDKEHLIGIPHPDTVVEKTDTLVVFGTLGDVNRFLEVNE